jgi:hypothetical protein
MEVEGIVSEGKLEVNKTVSEVTFEEGTSIS